MQRTSLQHWPDVPSIVECPAIPLYPVRQQFSNARTIDDLPGAVHRAVESLLVHRRPRGRVGIACGSRGIARIGEIVRAIVASLRVQGIDCVLIPAMGSHGGATPDGQAAVLEHLGIVAEGVPVDASMEAEVVGHLANGTPVFVARSALACDGVILVNRIKSHTDFHGPIESGLGKMAGIGLGKRSGAVALHALGKEGLQRWMPEAARLVASTGVLLGGIAVIEHARHDVAEVHAVLPEGIAGEHEAALLRRAVELQAGLPFDEADALVVGWIGKDISGTGMDTNVIGRMAIAGEPEPDRPSIGTIAALRMTAASGGNGHGMGLADFVTRALVDAVDLELTYVNALTSGRCGIQRARIPIVLPDDRRAISAAIACSGQPDLSRLRLALIADTLHIERLWVSEALLGECTGIEPDGPAAALAFDASGRLVDPPILRHDPSLQPG